MKDLSKFLQEKKEDSEKPRLLKKGEGADDKEFLSLMSDYKDMRRYNLEEASKFLEQAQKLGKDGDVSKKAQLAAAYL